MLTLEQILKAARLMSQVGEPRPGYLRDEDSCLTGPTPTERVSTADQSSHEHARTPKAERDQKTEIFVEYEKDPDTGEVFVVQRIAHK